MLCRIPVSKDCAHSVAKLSQYGRYGSERSFSLLNVSFAVGRAIDGGPLSSFQARRKALFPMKVFFYY